MPRGTLFQMRRGTAADWTSVNPVLAAGEMGIETDTRKFKFGDGTTAWTTLGYGSADGGSGTLPANVAYKDVDNLWSAGQTFPGNCTFTGGLGVLATISAYKVAVGFNGIELSSDTFTSLVDGRKGAVPIIATVIQSPNQTYELHDFRTFPAGHPKAAPAADVPTAATWLVEGAYRANAGLFDGPNRAYSDSNPPQSLERTILPSGPTAANNPAAGRSWEWTPDGKSLWIEAPDGTQTKIGPSAGIDMVTEYTTTTPPAPASGLTLFTRHRARRTLAQIGPTGLDTSLQPALFSNRIAQIAAVPGSATEPVLNFSVARTAAPTAQPLAATSFFTRLARLRYTTAAQAGNGNGIRSGTGTTGVAGYFLSNTANAGGFFFVARFGVGISQPGSRGFIGLANTLTQHPLTADPVGMGSVAHVGFGWNAAATTFSITTGTGSGTAGTGDLGALFPTKSSATDFYEVRLFAPSGSASTVHYSIQRLNTGDFVQGTRTTQLPPADTFMAAHVGISNGTTAAAAAIDIQSLYIETDN